MNNVFSVLSQILKMRLLFADCFGASLLVFMAVISSAKGAKSVSPSKPYAGNTMVCNLIQDSHVNEAFTKLEAKLEALIALVNKTYTPQPTPGKLTRSLIV